MPDPNSNPTRRDIIKAAAAVTLIGLLSPAALAGPVRTPTPGKPGDFAFLSGEWKIANKWRQKTTDAWLEFPGEATVHPILNGVGSVEELRIPARDFSGLGLRMLDADKRQWFDMWSNAKSGAITGPGVPGSLENGAFIFDSADSENGKPVISAASGTGSCRAGRTVGRNWSRATAGRAGKACG